jgi:hypothetical protein
MRTGLIDIEHDHAAPSELRAFALYDGLPIGVSKALSAGADKIENLTVRVTELERRLLVPQG